MLKTRLIPSLLFKDYALVKSIGFTNLRNLGNPIQAIKVYNSRNVDELVFLDIGATKDRRAPLFETVAEISNDCLMPLTIGGGINKIEHIRTLLKVGADKVSLNTNAIENPKLISKAAHLFGSQTIIVSIDVKKHAKGHYEVYALNGKKPTGISPTDWAQKAEKLGAGELLLTSIDRDGSMKGYDIELIKTITDTVTIPVIASGGAGKPQDFVDAIIKGHAHAVSAASIFHYTKYTPDAIKQYLHLKNVPVRL